MRQTYTRPELERVGSVSDITQATGTGSLVDVCIQIGGDQLIEIGASAIPGGNCQVVS